MVFILIPESTIAILISMANLATTFREEYLKITNKTKILITYYEFINYIRFEFITGATICCYGIYGVLNTSIVALGILRILGLV